jgi:hypothetical protein
LAGRRIRRWPNPGDRPIFPQPKRKNPLKKMFSLIAAIATLATASAFAGPVHVDFSGLSAGTVVTARGGIAFDMFGGPVASNAPTVNWEGMLTNSATAGAYPTASVLRATFDGVASGVSFSFYNAGWGGSGRGASFYSAFDALGNLLETGSLAPAASSVTGFTLSSSGIRSLEFNNNSGGASSWWFGLTSIDATDVGAAVPEPGTMALVGLALLGLGVSRRRSRA